MRGVEPGTTVLSPPSHSAFDSPRGLLEFVARLRELSGGKPVGFKLCIGRRTDFFAICKAMVETGITPDFITVDGGEGGTGAAPLEFSNSVGMPARDAWVFVHSALVACRAAASGSGSSLRWPHPDRVPDGPGAWRMGADRVRLGAAA
ncbi:MAG: glutamate synthase-related protein [Gammaproteobacteria bacterium]|nr:glutamate synthase-related protein [Gammaproteobacteria bacterium]